MAVRPNYHHLYHFWIVAQEGSLAGASRKLGLRHSTLSAQLQALEKSIGGRLLLRRPRGVRLTPQGEIVRGYCDQIFRLGTEMIEATAGQQVSRLRAGMLVSVPRSLLFSALQPALERGSSQRIEIVTGELHALCRELVAGRLHVVIADRLPQTAGSVHSQLIAEARITLLGTRRLATRYRSGFPSALDNAPVLLPAVGSSLREGLVAWFAEEGLRLRTAGEFDDMPTMLYFAAHGQGLVAVNQSLVGEVRVRYGLEPVGNITGLTDRLYALTLGRRMRHPGIQRLMDAARAKAGRR